LSIIVAIILAVSACGGGGGLSVLGDQTIVDTQVTLKDGERVSYALDAGRYRIELTADKDGASVTWLGADCPASGERNSYSGLCELKGNGQVVIENPTSFGLGAGSIVTVKIIKLR
jgi:hypothetical protein